MITGLKIRFCVFSLNELTDESLRITCFTDKKFPDETGMLTGG